MCATHSFSCYRKFTATDTPNTYINKTPINFQQMFLSVNKFVTHLWPDCQNPDVVYAMLNSCVLFFF